jgi:hypothetical protein
MSDKYDQGGVAILGLLLAPHANTDSVLDSGPQDVTRATGIAVDVSVKTISAGNIPFFYERLGADGVWYTLWTSAALAVPGTQQMLLHPRVAPQSGPPVIVEQEPGATGRLRWAFSAPATSNFSASIMTTS